MPLAGMLRAAAKSIVHQLCSCRSQTPDGRDIRRRRLTWHAPTADKGPSYRAEPIRPSASRAPHSAGSGAGRTGPSESLARDAIRTVDVGQGALEAQVEEARAALRLAQIDLSHTAIIAPEDGQVGEIVAIRCDTEIGGNEREKLCARRDELAEPHASKTKTKCIGPIFQKDHRKRRR
ncbi:hypothetical protein SAMN05216228_106623 [Rhizobium tibeticum]|uniref:Uncharacterized protein n=1 Tax=Rhizobium tibeticum TaxID=501024 RepID=A0A1H8WJI5_9HYPH|nr:hypothetical protein RTCCBAU85039_6455 [Rhizobium tibeticum]SEP27759.1 hypothetical protein SAMN05216228_106623 [Rhizobium tibeticum]